MKRHLLTIAVCLLFGAVVNVAVAWGYAIGDWLPVGQQTTTGVDQAEAMQVLADRLAVVAEPAGGYEECSVGRSFLVVYVAANHPIDHHLQVLATGWPCLALEGHVGLVHGRFRASGLLITRWERNHQAVAFPLRPIWPAFAANTLFYPTIVWLLIAGPFVLRRFLRLRRGLCPKCAYPMGESEVCTEWVSAAGLPAARLTPSVGW